MGTQTGPLPSPETTRDSSRPPILWRVPRTETTVDLPVSTRDSQRTGGSARPPPRRYLMRRDDDGSVRVGSNVPFDSIVLRFQCVYLGWSRTDSRRQVESWGRESDEDPGRSVREVVSGTVHLLPVHGGGGPRGDSDTGPRKGVGTPPDLFQGGVDFLWTLRVGPGPCGNGGDRKGGTPGTGLGRTGDTPLRGPDGRFTEILGYEEGTWRTGLDSHRRSGRGTE